MTRNKEVLVLIGFFLQGALARLEEEGDKRERGLSYQREQLVSDLTLFKEMTRLMEQLLLLHAIEDLIQIYYYNSRKSESSKQTTQLNKILWQMMGAILENL